VRGKYGETYKQQSSNRPTTGRSLRLQNRVAVAAPIVPLACLAHLRQHLAGAALGTRIGEEIAKVPKANARRRFTAHGKSSGRKEAMPSGTQRARFQLAANASRCGAASPSWPASIAEASPTRARSRFLFDLPEQHFGPWKQLGAWDDC
jgi:hypothetical protein